MNRVEPLTGTFRFAYHLLDSIYQIFMNINFEEIDIDSHEYLVSILEHYIKYRQELDLIKMVERPNLSDVIDLIDRELLEFRNRSIGAIYQQDDLSNIYKYCPDLIAEGTDYELTHIDFSKVMSGSADRLRAIQKKYVDTTAKMSFLITTSICKYHKRLKEHRESSLAPASTTSKQSKKRSGKK